MVLVRAFERAVLFLFFFSVMVVWTVATDPDNIREIVKKVVSNIIEGEKLHPKGLGAPEMDTGKHASQAETSSCDCKVESSLVKDDPAPVKDDVDTLFTEYETLESIITFDKQSSAMPLNFALEEDAQGEEYFYTWGSPDGRQSSGGDIASADNDTLIVKLDRNGTAVGIIKSMFSVVEKVLPCRMPLRPDKKTLLSLLFVCGRVANNTGRNVVEVFEASNEFSLLTKIEMEAWIDEVLVVGPYLVLKSESQLLCYRLTKNDTETPFRLVSRVVLTPSTKDLFEELWLADPKNLRVYRWILPLQRLGAGYAGETPNPNSQVRLEIYSPLEGLSSFQPLNNISSSRLDSLVNDEKFVDIICINDAEANLEEDETGSYAHFLIFKGREIVRLSIDLSFTREKDASSDPSFILETSDPLPNSHQFLTRLTGKRGTQKEMHEGKFSSLLRRNRMGRLPSSYLLYEENVMSRLPIWTQHVFNTEKLQLYVFDIPSYKLLQTSVEVDLLKKGSTSLRHGFFPLSSTLFIYQHTRKATGANKTKFGQERPRPYEMKIQLFRGPQKSGHAYELVDFESSKKKLLGATPSNSNNKENDGGDCNSASARRSLQRALSKILRML